MTAYADKSIEDIASRFIVDTIQLLPKENPNVFESMHFPLPFIPAKKSRFIVTCGSAAEFYIKPLIPCVADVDVLICENDQLAFIEDFLVLPNDLSGLLDVIKCFKIEPCLGYPGYVRLRVLGKMIYNWKHKNYRFCHTNCRNEYFRPFTSIPTTRLATYNKRLGSAFVTVRGPAIKHHTEESEYDQVESVWSPQWPMEANGWCNRPRNNGWPTTAIISEVVKSGFHVVHAQHRACINDDMQCRYSFSVAEVILLQSWTQVQQIVYHLLRFFAKRELIEKDCPKEDEVLCTYHFKTLMLWTCEEMPSEWWISSSLFAICCQLLQKLSEWLKKRKCPNYFIPEANLFYEPTNLEMRNKIEKRLKEFRNSGILCRWFVKNYIKPVAEKALGSEIFEMGYTWKFLIMISFLRRGFPGTWKAKKALALDWHFSWRFKYCNFHSNIIITSGFRSGLYSLSSLRMNSQASESIRCIDYVGYPTMQSFLFFRYLEATMYLLYAAYYLGFGKMLWDGIQLLETVKGNLIQSKIVRSHFHNFPKPAIAERNHSHFLRAQDLMQNLTGSNGRSEFQLLSLISKEFLSKALEYEDSASKSIVPPALIYLAALHFATSEYQTVLDLCSVVKMHQTLQKEDETLNAGCLFFIDDVARIVGFYLLYKKIKNNVHYNRRQVYLDLRLTPQVFAHYLAIISSERMSRQLELNIALPTSAFCFDQLLLVLTMRKHVVSMNTSVSIRDSRHCVYRRSDSLTKNETLNVAYSEIKEKTISLLMECGMENMTSFYNVIRNDLGIQCNIVDCYRALHLYKCRQYAEVLQLCERILHAPDPQSDLKEFAFANVLVLPPLDSFFDEDVQCLLGFHTLFCYLSPENDSLLKIELTSESTYEHQFAHSVYNANSNITAYLMYSYSLKCHYFLGRHFLARYLKLRCCVDCNHPSKEINVAFAAMKCNLPFERIIRRFLLTKLRKIHQ